MPIKLGNTEINKLYLANTEIKKAYLGNTLFYDKTVIPETRLVYEVDSSKSGTSSSNQFTIPTTTGGGATFNYSVTTDDGYSATGITENHTITFPSGAGIHKVYISGTFERIFFNNGGDRLKLTKILNWGTIVPVPNQTGAYYGCANLTEIAGDNNLWDSNVVTASNAFRGCTSLPSIKEGFSLSAMTVGSSTFRDCGMSILPSTLTLVGIQNGNACLFGTPLTDLPPNMKLSAITGNNGNFFSSTINTSRYSQLLIDMKDTNPNLNVTFGGGTSKYNSAGKVARDILISRGWIITDGGLE